MNPEFYIAKRYLFKKKANNVVNIISGIAVFGVAIGTLALIVVLSVFNGFEGLVSALYKSFDPDIKITSVEGKTFLLDSRIQKGLNTREEILCYSGIVEEKALLRYEEKQYTTIIKGVDTLFNKTTNFAKTIKKGNYCFHVSNKKRCVVGLGVANFLSLPIEEDLNIPRFNPVLEVYVPKKGLNISLNTNDVFNSRKISPTGIFSIQADFDSKYIITSLFFAQELLEYSPNEITAIELSIKKNTDPSQLKEKLQKDLGAKFLVQTQEDLHEALFKMMKTEKIAVLIIFTFILIIATFNMLAAIVMLIIEKGKDIQTLRYLGATTRMIQRIYFLTGFAGILFGATIGVFFGGAICLVQEKFKIIKMPDGFVINHYPIDIQALDLVMIFGIILTVGIITAYLPTHVLKRKILNRNHR